MEFYANMVGMKEDSVCVRGVCMPFGHRRINEMLKLRGFSLYNQRQTTYIVRCWPNADVLHSK